MPGGNRCSPMWNPLSEVKKAIADAKDPKALSEAISKVLAPEQVNYDPVPGPGQSLLLGISFAAWKSAVGTSLFVACGKYTAALSHQEAL